ncbi:hypothetical protein ThrDRAFT_01966 [Frankia casuarinae]|uniref:Uncharacterized protein n=2 Tax=Frankia casuarinae (strain DSM 45818 / CECT 9043 / HFP020203 / CcI3) TaxID=106370 RepID=Q2JCN4_FRACC|nr:MULTISPECIES: hypothetical protein [Frankia]ABD10958.1 hypothetical protein Francci3_1582 [Frankia casuarinae]ETA02190.1 hypothetical protein CcI6DRAFT_02365 [Frankia sp. CcI6]EYT92356.1 hypothetical protein ThrDRAFT_01966 [Frankia casuarinae]KDA42873.1 hypothetical protein BMG523Draft_02262 [Frankia sp. BMG5.23]KFB06006.1 hypothetical protein ALLO2DRAFT_01291 [Frankia sp. Allo2]
MSSVYARRTTQAALVAVTVMLAFLVVCRTDSPVRVLLAVPAAFLLPGAAVLARLPVDGTAAWIGLAVAISLAVDVLTSMLMVWSGWWHPAVMQSVVGLACCAVLIHSLRAELRAQPRARPRADGKVRGR